MRPQLSPRRDDASAFDDFLREQEKRVARLRHVFEVQRRRRELAAEKFTKLDREIPHE